MGYYSFYELEIRDEITFAKAKEILESLNKKIGWELFTLKAEAEAEDIDPSETDYWDICTEDNTKWYDWEEDMYNISKEFPDIEFGVEKIGEDHDDWYYGLFKNGKSKLNQCSAPLREW